MRIVEGDDNDDMLMMRKVACFAFHHDTVFYYFDIHSE